MYAFIPESERQGISDRTNNMLTSPKHSSTRDHSHSCDTPFSINDFSILDTEPSRFALRILESLYTHKHRPKINGNLSAHTLYVVK